MCRAVAAVALQSRFNGALPVIMLMVGASRHFLWHLMPMEWRGSASKALGGAALLALIWIIYLLSTRARWLLPVLLWWSVEELQVVLCSVAYIVEPWVVPVGKSICSARLDLDIGAVTIVAVAALLVCVQCKPTRSCRVKQEKVDDNE